MRTFGVTDLVEAVDLFLQLLEHCGEGLFVEESEQGLVEAFVLALRGRCIEFTGDRLHPERGDIGEQWPRTPRRDGFNAAPLSLSNLCGAP